MNGPELAHYHFVEHKICISEKQLKKQDLEELEDTTIHEMIHHLGLMHDTADEKAKFERIKNYVRSNVWRPEEGGSQFISREQVREADERIRKDPKLLASVNEDSDYIKFIEGRPTSSGMNRSKKENERPKIVKKAGEAKEAKAHETTPYKPMTNDEIEEARKKLGIAAKETSEKKPVQGLDDKELERLTNKAYENMDTGFGDEYVENRWNKRKKGLLGRIKNILQIH